MSPRPFFAGWRPALVAGLFAALIPSLHARTWLVDFGPNNGTDGNATPSGTPAPIINPGNGSTGVADSNSKFWNNAVGAGNTGGPVAMSYLRLIDTTNAPTKVGLTLGPGWKSNGRNTGGLLSPDAGKLGDFAIGRATEDYFFVDGANGNYATLNLNNLDPAKLYNLRLFGTRDAAVVRKTLYTVSAGNGVFNTVLQTSGSDLVSATDGNDSTIASLSGLQTDASGQLTLRVTAMEGGFGYLGILELTEGEAATPIASKTVRVDFGRHDSSNGNPTVSPDSFGKYWNNFGAIANGSAVSNLITTTNEVTPMGITLTSTGWQNNGINNGGLTAVTGLTGPLASRLGELAVDTATQDYLFINGPPGFSSMLRVSGLNPLKHYSMRFFGTRNETAIRRSIYTITAGNGTFAGTLQSSGPGIGNSLGGDDPATPVYNGNNRSTVALGGMQPNAAGELSLQLSVAQGDFAYLGIMEIVESIAVPALPISNGIDRWTAQDALDPVGPGGVLFVGSSTIRRWENLTKDFADYRIVQRGFGGSQFSDLNPLVNRIVTPYQPSAIVVFEGTNDIRVGNKTGDQVLLDFQTFVSTVRAQQPAVSICYLGITPCPSFDGNENHELERQNANALIKAHCESDPGLNLHFLNGNEFFENLRATDTEAWRGYFVDDTHLNQAGYQQLASLIRPTLAAVIAPNRVYTANPAALVAGEKLFFDFGPTDIGNGEPTTGADPNGNHWNNWHLTNGGVIINSGEHLGNLVRSTGTGTGIRMTMTGGFECNGKNHGGLFSPQPGLLGQLALTTATEDFFFTTSNDLNDVTSEDIPGSFMMEGLDPALEYEFRFFGSRSATETRVTKYTVSGANSGETTLTTTGPAIASNGGDGNNRTVAVIRGIRPDAFGQVFIDLTLVQGSFAYINAMQITASVVGSASAYDAWRSSHFTSEELGNPDLEDSLWGSDADADGDGRVNLLEYAAGTDPRTHDANPVSFALETAGGDFLTLTYQRNLAATDVSFEVQRTGTLESWLGVSDVLVSTAGGIETRKASVSRTGFPGLWLRLKVEPVTSP